VSASNLKRNAQPMLTLKMWEENVDTRTSSHDKIWSSEKNMHISDSSRIVRVVTKFFVHG